MNVVLNQTNTRRYRKRMLRPQIRIGSVTLTFSLIIITCIISGAYLLHNNHFQTLGYEIRSLENEKAELEKVNRRLKLKIAKAKSLESIQNSGVVSQMVRVKDPISYDIDNKIAMK